jgi:F0F1-type ATP synthase assembly protein I
MTENKDEYTDSEMSAKRYGMVIGLILGFIMGFCTAMILVISNQQP